MASLHSELQSDTQDDDDDSQYMHDAGQYEPLTTRLKNILDEYDDRTIIKELLQNAEDAGAKEFNILFDGRTHPSDCLRLPGMASTHGPALVVHNDAEFSEKDFDNITKLAGGTKKDDPLKIGKFGVGFCSVYHLTDVPSFVSGKWLYIFDPTFEHLGDVIHDRNQPGKKIEFARMFKTGAQQMAPYENLFGFKTSKNYTGSLFRLPLRTSPSKISKKTYTSENLEQIISDLQVSLLNEASSLLLFLRNVKKVTFQSISDKCIEPKMSAIITHGDINVDEATRCMSIFEVINYNVTAGVQPIHSKCIWAVSNFTKSVCIDVADTKEEKTGIASVAVKLLQHNDGRRFICEPVHGEAFCFLPLDIVTGLPVHISANFSVMSNRKGIWMNKADRNALKDQQHQNLKEIWNQILLEEFLVEAYIKILLFLKQLSIADLLVSYIFDDFFPLAIELTDSSWAPMVKSFYHKVAHLPLFQSCTCIAYWPDSKLVKQKLIKFALKDELLQWSTTAVLNALHFLSAIDDSSVRNLVLTSSEVFQELNPEGNAKNEQSGGNRKRWKKKSKTKLNRAQQMMTSEELIKLFLKNIYFISDIQLRNDVLYDIFNFALSNPQCIIPDLLKEEACIPCQPDGKILKKPSQLIWPSSQFSEMLEDFMDITALLPIDKFLKSNQMCKFLSQIGLLEETIPVDAIIDCIKSIVKSESSYNKILSIFQCIFNTPEVELRNHSFADAVQNVRFIPVLPKPSNYEGKWKAEVDDCQWATLSEVFIQFIHSQQEHFLLGSQKYFVKLDIQSILAKQKKDMVYYFRSLSSFTPSLEECHKNRCGTLKIQCTPTIDDALNQFQCIYNSVCDKDSKMSESFINKSMEIIYSFLNEKLSESYYNYELCERLKNFFTVKYQNSIYIKGKLFVSPQNVAKLWNQDSEPFLYQLPSILMKCQKFTTALGIANSFGIEKLIKTLKIIYETSDSGKYSEVIQQIIYEMNRQFVNPQHYDHMNGVSYYTNASNRFGDINLSQVVLPDNHNKLHPVHELVINDDSWLPLKKGLVEVSRILDRKLALDFGVKQWCKDLYCERFTKCNINIKGYGQSEELTSRIKSILRDYPRDVTLLHELLQNADDAKASKMYVILDKRKHNCEKVPTDGWEKLQGPSLLIWNDGDFTEEDIDALQYLGLGSKREDPDSIGQFGIGFCVVYHVTDCPSFVVKEDTLCLLDPHFSYISGTDRNSRGLEMSDLLKGSFWNTMSDMASAYLQTKNDRPEFKNGVLFRLPLRLAELERYKTNNNTEKLGDMITTGQLERELETWVPMIKEALLFLPHVHEFRYYIIDEGGLYTEKALYTVCNHVAGDTNMQKIRIEAVEDLKLRTTKYEEEWLIQKCPANELINIDKLDSNKLLDSPCQCGIAAPLNLPEASTKFHGKLYNFLPLPINSNLPVHLNAKFDLTTNRRALMSGKINRNMFKALSHLYVMMLEQARSIMVSETYSSLKKFRDDIDAYFCLYPFLEEIIDLGNEDFTLSSFKESFFEYLWQKNASIMPSHSIQQNSSKKELIIQWHNLTSKSRSDGKLFQKLFFTEPSTYRDRESADIPVAALREVGIIICDAPFSLYLHLSKTTNDHNKPQLLSSLTAFDFFCKNYTEIIGHDNFPCSIVGSPFTLENFMKFIVYILHQPKGKPYCSFVKLPFDYPLLVTADEKIRKFDKKEQVLQSKYSFIFPKSKELFLHSDFPLNMDPSYFMKKSGVLSKFKKYSVMEKNFNTELCQTAVNNGAKSLISDKKLIEIWECFSSEEIFETEHILSQWALIPATNGHLYSIRSKIRPLIPLVQKKHSTESRQSEEDGEFNCLSRYLPVLDEQFLKYSVIKQYCFHISWDNELILTALSENLDEVFNSLKRNKADLDLITNYLMRIDFRKTPMKSLLKHLPIFKIIVAHDKHEDLDLVDLKDKKVYLWPQADDICTAGLKHWLPDKKKVVFLHPDCSWNSTCEFVSIAEAIDPKEIFFTFVSPMFEKLNDTERKEQLRFVKDNLIDQAILDAGRLRKSVKNTKAYTIAQKFITSLKQMCCFKDEETRSDEKLYPIQSFCDHTQPIFKAKIKPSQFKFIPHEYRQADDEEWLKFFCHLGLRTEPSFPEFVTMCLSIQESSLKQTMIPEKLSESSDILLQYLFSKNGRQWLSILSYSSKISSIPFILPVRNGLPFEIQGLKHYERKPLVCFSKSAISDHKYLLWTVYPIVHLKKPNDIDEKQFMALLEKLNVKTSPEVSDVFENICNIASSNLSRFSLFHKYDVNYIDDTGLIRDTIFKSLKFIQHNSEKNMEYLKKLSNIHCLPVLRAEDDNGKIVLIPPVQMVQRMTVEEKCSFKSYLHERPFFMDLVGFVLFSIGVEEKIGYKHMETILTMINTQSKEVGGLDFNHLPTVRNVILKLGRILKANQYVHETSLMLNSDSNPPLYLPYDTGKGWRLEDSTKMYYPDLIRYSQIECSSSEFCVFKIPPESEHNKAVHASFQSNSRVPKPSPHFEVSEIDVCMGIQKRPMKLSAHCKEVLVMQDKVKSKCTSPLYLQIHRYFRHKYYDQLILILPNIIRSLSRHTIHEEAVDKFTKQLHQLVHKMSVLVLESLTVQVYNGSGSTLNWIVKPNVYLQHDVSNKHYKLYVSKHATARPRDLLEVAEVMCLEVLKNDGFKKVFLDERMIASLKQSLQKCFEVSSLHQVKILCETYNVSWEKICAKKSTEGSQQDDNDDNDDDIIVKPQLGFCIPEIICDLYLDRDDRNQYNPQEWVGYEIEEEIFNWAIVLYKNEDDSSYTIMVDIEDRKTITKIAPVASLCKFLTDTSETEAESLTSSQYSSILTSNKLEIDKQLRSIRQRDEEDETAENVVRRLYIKYHPNTVKKNKEHLFQELHKYLLQELPDSRWKHMFPQWDMHLNRIHRNRSKVKRSSRKVRWLPPDDENNDTELSTATKSIESTSSPDVPVSDTKTKTSKLQPQPSPDEAKRWLRQAEADRNEMKHTDSACHKLFLAHEVIEKSLKAAIYQLVGLNPKFLKHHDIKTHACSICSLLKKKGHNVHVTVPLIAIATNVQEKDYYLKARFPNQIDETNKSPVDIYTHEEANKVSSDVEDVFNFIKSLI